MSTKKFDSIESNASECILSLNGSSNDETNGMGFHKENKNHMFRLIVSLSTNMATNTQALYDDCAWLNIGIDRRQRASECVCVCDCWILRPSALCVRIKVIEFLLFSLLVSCDAQPSTFSHRCAYSVSAIHVGSNQLKLYATREGFLSLCFVCSLPIRSQFIRVVFDSMY